MIYRSLHRRPHLVVIAGSITALLVVCSARATPVYWDTNGDTSGASGGASANGTWDAATTANWSTNSAGTSATSNYSAANGASPSTADVIFSAGTSATGASTITIDAQMTGTGVTANSITIEEGSIAIATSGTFDSGAALTLGAGGLTIASTTLGNSSFSSTTTIALAADQIWANNRGSSNFTASGVISGAGIKLTKTGAGILTLTGANTFSGGLVISSGTVNGNSGTAAQTFFGTGSITLGDSNTTNGATLRMGGAANSITNAIVLGGNAATSGTLIIGNINNSTNVSYRGGITGANSFTISNSGTASITFSTGAINNSGTITNANGSSGDVLITSAIGANVTGVIQNSSSSAMTLSGANTSFAGGTTLSAGTLRIGNAAALGSGSLTIAGGTTLDTSSGTAQSLTTNNQQTWNGNFTFAGTANLNLGTGTVSLGATAGSRTITAAANTLTVGGVISDGIGTGLTKAGLGTLILNGANEFSGGTTLSAGTLKLGNAAALGTGGLTIAGGTTLDNASGAALTLSTDNAQIWNGDFTFTGSASLNLGNGAVSLGAAPGDRTITVSGSILTVGGIISDGVATGLIKAGGGQLTLGGANNFTGNITIKAGTLQTAGTNPVNPLGTSTVILGDTTGSAAAKLILQGTTSTYSNALVLNTGGTLTVGTLNNSTTVVMTGGITGANSLIFASTGDAGLVFSTAAVNNSGTLTNASTRPGTIAINSVIGTNVTGVIQNSSTSQFTLGGANTYTGTTAINAGTLLINGNQVLATGAVSVGINGTLGGTGTVGGATTISGTHSPGASPGVQTFANGLTYATGANLKWELASNTDAVGARGMAVGGFDGINVTGGVLSIQTGVIANLVANSAGSTLNWSDGFWSSGHTWLAFSDASAPTLASGAIFDTINVSSDNFGNTFALTGGTFSFITSGNNVVLNYAVPEPGALVSLLGGLGTLLGLQRFRRRR